MTLHPIPVNFLTYEENFVFFFIRECFDVVSSASAALASFTLVMIRNARRNKLQNWVRKVPHTPRPPPPGSERHGCLRPTAGE
jgi:hypothetical protein